MRVLLVIPTYEPYYIHRPDLEQFYTENFDSFLNPEGNADIQLVITDFASSKSHRAFLRRYVESREGCFLIEGDQGGSPHVAFNVALHNFEYDYVARLECDLRTRDRHWLKILLREFEDPKVQIAIPTVNRDGNKSCEQNQDNAFERESRPVGLNEQFNIHCPIFSRRFFEPFDNRYPDMFEWHHNEFAVMYQLFALGQVANINFRANLVHGDPQVLPLKPAATGTGWGSRNDLDAASTQQFLRRTANLLNFLPTTGAPLTKRIRLHLEALKTQRWRYFYYRIFAKRIFEDFCQLDMPTKEAVIRALFFRPLSDYEKFSYSIYPSIPIDSNNKGYSVIRSTIHN